MAIARYEESGKIYNEPWLKYDGATTSTSSSTSTTTSTSTSTSTSTTSTTTSTSSSTSSTTSTSSSTSTTSSTSTSSSTSSTTTAPPFDVPILETDYPEKPQLTIKTMKPILKIKRTVR